MPAHDVVTIGASAGGVEALITLVRDLPSDLPAALFVALHIPAHSPSHLPSILSHHGPLPAAHAEDGGTIEQGRIYVAPPDQHMLVRDGHVELTRGPRENGSRPAVDPLFRSAGRAYGARAIGIVLSGALSDGALGLNAIAARGGITIVQDPDEALFDGMPRAALTHGRIDYIVRVGQMPTLLTRLVNERAAEGGRRTMHDMDDMEERSRELVESNITAQARNERGNETTIYTCPECGGTLWQINQNGLMQFRCHVGHAYESETLLDEMSEEVEAALWRCVRMMTEKATLTRQFAGRLRASGQEARAVRVDEQAQLDDRHGQLIRDLLLDTASSPTSQTLVVEKALDEARHENPRTG